MRTLRNCYESLTPREREVMALVVSGLLNKQVGGELGISEITVKAHRGQVMRKMKADSLPDLVTWPPSACGMITLAHQTAVSCSGASAQPVDTDPASHTPARIAIRAYRFHWRIAVPSPTTRVLFTVLLLVWPATHVTTRMPQPRARRRTSHSSRGSMNTATTRPYSVLADGQRLVAIIGEGKFPLRASGTDTFTNAGGDSIPFLRDASGRIVAFKEKGIRSPVSRRAFPPPPVNSSRLVPVRTGSRRPIATCRPLFCGRDPSGQRRARALPKDVAEQLVNGIIDGTYPDVRAIAVYRRGRCGWRRPSTGTTEIVHTRCARSPRA